MEDVVKSFCKIDNKNESNKCVDLEYNEVYNNKDTGVYKVNYFNSPSSLYLNPGSNSSQPSNIGSQFNKFNSKSISPIDINYGHFPLSKDFGIIKPSDYNNLSDNLNNIPSNGNIFNNNTNAYAHMGHVKNDNTTIAYSQI